MTKGKCKTMLEIREVIHRLREGHSDRRIWREIGVDRSVVKKIRILSILHQWLDISLAMPTDETIAKFLKSKSKNKSIMLWLFIMIVSNNGKKRGILLL